MNGSSTRIFQNVRYDLVLNDDNPNDYYFEPTGPDVSASGIKDQMLPAGNKNTENKEGAKVDEYKKEKKQGEKEKPAAKKTKNTKKKRRLGKKGKNKQAKAIIKKSHENYLEAL